MFKFLRPFALVGVLEEVDEGDVLLKPPGSESSVPAGEKSDDGKDGDVKVDVEKEATTMSKAMGTTRVYQDL